MNIQKLGKNCAPPSNQRRAVLLIDELPLPEPVLAEYESASIPSD